MATSNEARIRNANDEILGKADLSAIERMFAPDYVAHIGGKDHKGPAFVKRYVRQLREAIPNVRVVKISVLMRSGDTIAWERTLSGTHKAPLKGIPASGKKVTWTDMLVTRFASGKIAEEWAVSDLAGQLMLKLPRA
jgi:predicted ester cyclase